MIAEKKNHSRQTAAPGHNRFFLRLVTPIFHQDVPLIAYRTAPGALERLDLKPECAGHLAFDEALIQAAESGVRGESIRVWESAQTFVVLGAGGKWAEEVHHDQAVLHGIPVLRRCSGGGTVLQGPGCLNFVAVLDTRLRPELRTVDGTTEIVLGSVLQALAAQGYQLRIQGTSDLAHGDRKVSGNAQRRRKNFILFHGTLLTKGFRLPLIDEVLTHPHRQPEWRNQRAHREFVDGLNLDRDRFWGDWVDLWGATPQETPEDELLSLTRELVLDKYTRVEWNQSL